MNWGGMPQRFSLHSESEVRTYLQDLFNSVVLRDIVQRDRRKGCGPAEPIMEYLMAISVADIFFTGNPEIFQECGPDSQYTDAL